MATKFTKDKWYCVLHTVTVVVDSTRPHNNTTVTLTCALPMKGSTSLENAESNAKSKTKQEVSNSIYDSICSDRAGFDTGETSKGDGSLGELVLTKIEELDFTYEIGHTIIDTPLNYPNH